MTDPTQRFSGRAADYAQYRERYDAEPILALLRSWCGLTPGWLVADVGAGTGMLGDIFRANGNRVIAIEPNEDMRTACMALHAGDAGFAVIEGSAETTGLNDASVDLVAAGRALHWFDVERAMAEFRRILRPAGWVVIVAQGRAEDGRDENVAFEMLLRETCHTLESTRRGYGAYVRIAEIFAAGIYRHAESNGAMQLDWEGLRGMALSLSHAPLAGSPEFAPFEAALQTFFERFAQEGKITLATRLWVNAGRFEP